MPKAYDPKPAADSNGDKFRLSDHVGTTLAITVQSVEEEVNTKYGLKDAIKADVTIVDGLMAGMDFGDVLLFQAAVVNSLRDFVGDDEPVVAKVIETTSKSGNTYLGLAAPSADAWDKAQALYVTTPPASGDAELPF